ncbi:MAG: alpha-2-macroglobulin family protein [Candidatus Limisoma sp.]
MNKKVASLIAAAASIATGTAKAPDFAFPETVADEATKIIAEAQACGNDQALIDGMVRLALAKSSISDDYIPELIDKTDSLAVGAKQASTRSILLMFEADLYKAMRSNNEVYIGRREQTDVVPTDRNEWSLADFNNKINNLIEASLSDYKSLAQLSADDFKNIIAPKDYSRDFYPTLYDLLAHHALDILESQELSFVPVFYRNMSDIVGCGSFKLPGNGEPSALTMSIYTSLLDIHKSDIAPTIITEVRRIKLLYDRSSQTRIDALFALYNTFKSSEYSTEALIELVDCEKAADKLYTLAQDQVKAFPNYSRIGYLRNFIADYEQVRADIKCPDIVTPDKDFSLTVSAANTEKVIVKAYDITDYSERLKRDDFVNRLRRQSPKITKIYNVNHRAGDEIETEVTFPGLDVGKYVLVVEVYDTKSKRRISSLDKNDYAKVRSTNLELVSRTIDNERRIYVYDATTGHPVTGAAVTITEEKNKSTQKTNRFGYIVYDDSRSKSYYSECCATLGNDRSADLSVYRDFYYEKNTHNEVNVVTDLAVYRPGDTVRFSAVAYSTSKRSGKLVAGVKLNVRLRDTNSEIVDSLSLTTDSLGRIAGQLKIPTDGMTGQFGIQVSGSGYGGSKWITVSEYKAPTFFVELNREASHFATADDIKCAGRVATYSQFPVAGATVKCTFTPARSWWDWDEPDGKPYTATTTTADDGTWTVDVSQTILDGKNFGRFNVSVEATSPAGETQSASETVCIGSKLGISLSDATIEASPTAKLNLSVSNLEERAVDARCAFTLTDADKNSEAARGEFSSLSPVVDLSAVASGRYTLKVWLTADTTVESSCSLVVYRSADAQPPYDTPLWVETSELQVAADGTLTVDYKSSSASCVFFVLEDDVKTLASGNHMSEKGRNTIVLRPEIADDKTAKLTLSAFVGHKMTKRVITVKPAEPLGETRIVKETFRDFITPSTPERWRFRLENDRQRLAGAMIAYMYDAALNSIEPNFPEFGFYMSQLTPFSERMNNVGYGRAMTYGAAERFATSNILRPYINMYNRQLGAIRFMPRALYCMAAPKHGYKAEESEDFDMVEPEAVCDMGSSEMKMASKENAEPTVEESAAGGIDDNFNYRDPSIKTAFFMPTLVTDADGVVTIDFDVPNVNTQWQFCAVAYTADLRKATIKELVTASKPVMVQANLPRFVRHGDAVILPATVMNNSSEQIETTVTIEIFDAATLKTLLTRSAAVTLEPLASQVVDITVDADITAAIDGLGYRIKAATDNFADGEQHLLPVLAATTPVVEAKPFYIRENEQSVTFAFPKVSKGRITLEYCDNPTWYCVAALPSLVSESVTATAQARNFFVASVAEGIVGSSPMIADAIKQWHADDSLTSNLNKNADLKTISLNNSPWLTDAERETENMRSLVDLTDQQTIASRKAKALSMLRSLQNSDGGIRWFKDCESSLWMTLDVLEEFGMLNQMGYYDGSADRFIEKACSYADNEVADQIKCYKIKPSEYHQFFDFILVRSMFVQVPLSGKAAEVKDEVINYTVQNWRDYSLDRRIQAAILLANVGKKAEAKRIVESLRQHARKDDTWGYYWDTEGRDRLWLASKALIAFYTVDPSDPDINNIRRWILLTKETRNWGESPAACMAVNAILATGTSWTNTDRRQAEITVDSKPVDYGTDSRFGYVRRSFDASEVAGKDVTIKRYGYNPAWGAAYVNYEAPMTEVRRNDSRDISINKALFRYDSEGNLKSVANDQIRVGDKLQVRLTLKSTRDMNYVAVTDQRPAAFEPVDQVPTYDWRDGIFMLRETRDAQTNIFITGLPKGTFVIAYDVYVNNAGQFASGIATAQCLYAPQHVAHSAGTIVKSGER